MYIIIIIIIKHRYDSRLDCIQSCTCEATVTTFRRRKTVRCVDPMPYFNYHSQEFSLISASSDLFLLEIRRKGIRVGAGMAKLVD